MSWEEKTMQSRTSFFSPGVARKSAVRYWPVWAAYLALWLLLLPGSLGGGRYYDRSAYGVAVRCDGTVLGLTGAPAAILTAVFACFAAMAVWSYLLSPRAAGFYHALPVRREGLFLTQFLTGYGFLAVPAVVTALATYIVELTLGYGGGLPYILEWLAVMLLLSLFFFGLATVCAFMTGHPVALPILYFLFNFSVVVVEYLVRSAVGLFLRGLSVSTSPRLDFLSPVVHLVQRDYVYYGAEEAHYAGFPYLGLLAAAGVLLSLCALLLYRRRHVESAGDVIAVPFLRPVFRVVFSLGCAVVLGSVFYELLGNGHSRILYALCLLTGGAIGYLAAEMLLKKRFRVLAGCWKRLLAVLAVVLVLSGGVVFDLFGVERWVPEPGDVRSVFLCDNELTAPEDLARVEALHRMILSSPEEDGGETAGFITFSYVLKSGKMVYRNYHVYGGPGDHDDVRTPLGLCGDLLNSERVILRRALPPEGARIKYITVWTPEDDARPVDTGKQALLLEALRADAAAGTLDSWQGNDNTETLAFRLELCYYTENGDATYSINLVVRENDAHACAVLNEEGNWN